jgi:hypothetical protein
VIEVALLDRGLQLHWTSTTNILSTWSRWNGAKQSKPTV